GTAEWAERARPLQARFETARRGRACPTRLGRRRMTFCLGVTVEEGLVGVADTRVVSGFESLTARKVATYQGPGYSFFVMTSGLRSLRDKVLLCFEEAFSQQISARERLFKLVNLYAAQVRRIANEDAKSLEESDLHFNIYSLIGGQMSNDGPRRLFLIYPEVNW